MSEKMECPGCRSYSSSITRAVYEGNPCPSCGLSANAIMEIHVLHQSRADEEMRNRVEALSIENDRLKTALQRHERFVQNVSDQLQRLDDPKDSQGY